MTISQVKSNAGTLKTRPMGQPTPSAPAAQGWGRDRLELTGRAATSNASKTPAPRATQPLPAPRALADVMSGAEAVYSNIFAQSNDAWRKLIDKPWHLQVFRGDWYQSFNDCQANLQLNSNAGNQRVALADLSVEQRSQYDRLSAVLEPLNPMVRLAFQLLLVKGQLARTQPDGKTLLDSLSALTTAPLAPEIDRTVLLGELVQEVANPIAIWQGFSGTCTVTSMQIQLAKQQPGEYVRLVAGLASPEGKVAMMNGEELVRVSGSELRTPLRHQGKDLEDPRTLTSRLFQSAMMDFGDGPDIRFDMTTSTHVSSQGDLGKGLFSHQSARAYSALSGRSDVPAIRTDAASAAAMMDMIRERSDRGESTPISMLWDSLDAPGQDFHHMVLVLRLDDQGVLMANPWGELNLVPLEDVKKRISEAHLLSEK